MSFKRFRIELLASTTIDTGSIAEASLTKWTAEVSVPTAEHPRDHAELLAEHLLVNRILIPAGRDRHINIC